MSVTKEEKLLFIKKILKDNNFMEALEHFKDGKNIDIIYNIFNGNTEYVETDGGIFEYYMALFHYFKFCKAKSGISEGNFKVDYEEAKKYDLIAIDKGNSYAMNHYANMMKKENKFEEAKKYWLMAIELGNDVSMNTYAIFMEREDMEISKKYYLMAIEMENNNAMNNYAILMKMQGNISEAKKWFLKAIENGNVNALFYYAHLLWRNENNIEEAKKWFLKAIENGNVNALFYYAKLKEIDDKKEAIKYFYKHYEKTNDANSLDEINGLLKNREMAIMIGQIVIHDEEKDEKIKELQNYRSAVNDLGPMNALVLGYI